MAYLGMPDPEMFKAAIRSGVTRSWTVDASFAGAPVVGATGLVPVGGSITDTTKPGVRRTLNVDLAGGTDLYDLLAPAGTVLTVTEHVAYTNRTTVDIPMGVFDVDSQRLTEGDGRVSLTAPDKWGRIVRARFIGPEKSYAGVTVVGQITNMIRDALGPSEPVIASATSLAAMTSQVWEKDRDQAIIGLAKDIGAWVYFDRNGIATIADVPTIGSSADWLVDAGASGVMISLDRERSRQGAYNLVVVSSSATDGERFPPQFVWDDDPTSKTFAGTDPRHGIGVGPFGVVPYYLDSPILGSAAEARTAGWTVLARVSGLASKVSFTQAPNCAMDAFDVIDVLPLRQRAVGVEFVSAGGGFGVGSFGTSPFGTGSGEVYPRVIFESTAVLERHIADTVTHGLTVTEAQTVDGRSTRTEEITGGS